MFKIYLEELVSLFNPINTKVKFYRSNIFLTYPNHVPSNPKESFVTLLQAH